MGKNFTEFSEKTTGLVGTDFVVGYDQITSGGEKKYTLSTISKAVSSLITPALSADAWLTATGSNTARSLANRFADVVNVKDFGAVGDWNGTTGTDDTVAIQAAINFASAGRTIYFPNGTYLTGPLTIPKSITLAGDGPSSVLLHKISTTGSVSSTENMIYVSGTATKFSARHLLFNGNQVNQPYLGTRTIGANFIGSSTDSARFDIENCIFRNGNTADISLYSDTSYSTTELVRISNCTFLGGAEGDKNNGAAAIIIFSAMDLIITDNFFDLQKTPTAYGRAGIDVADVVGGYTNPSGRGIIANNKLNGFGRRDGIPDGGTGGSIGSIEVYNGARDLVVSGNVLTNPYSRGIDVKTDGKNVIIANNIVDGLFGIGLEVLNGSQIACYGAYTETEESSGNYIITNNVCENSGYDGITVESHSIYDDSFGDNVTIEGNVVNNCVRRSIYLGYAKTGKVIGNIINGGAGGITIRDTNGPIDVSNNLIKGVSGNGVYFTNNSWSGVSFNSGSTTVIGTFGGSSTLFAVGSQVVISGADSNINGIQTITASTTTSFTFVVSVAPSATSTGSVSRYQTGQYNITDNTIINSSASAISLVSSNQGGSIKSNRISGTNSSYYDLAISGTPYSLVEILDNSLLSTNPYSYTGYSTNNIRIINNPITSQGIGFCVSRSRIFGQNTFHFEDSTAGSSFLSNAGGGKFIIDSSGYNILQFGSGGSGYSSGLYHCKPSGVGVGQLLYVYSDDTYRMTLGSSESFRWKSDRYYPISDNTVYLGTASNRWNTIYLGTGGVNTSDEREKQQIRSIESSVLAAWAKVNFKQFKFNDAVEAKGDKARLHFGVIAQQVKEAFESEGIDGFKYGILCYDEWEETTEENDADGNMIVSHKPAGNIYGIRYEEALVLECAYQRSVTEKLIARIEALESK